MNVERICKNCKWRLRVRRRSFCNNDKLSDDVGQDEAFRADALLYEYGEGGGFIVGENFGCVHFEAKHQEVKEEKEPVEIAGLMFPPGTTVRSADRFHRLSIESEWIPVIGWEFKTPFLEPNSAIFEKEDLGEAAKEFYDWLGKRGLLNVIIHEGYEKDTIKQP